MLYQHKGDRFAVTNKIFTVGGHVFANGASDYMGLLGTVKKIKTEDDRETADICCAFDPLKSLEYIRVMEQGEATQCQTPKTEVQNSVIMSPDMLEPIPTVLPESTGSMYVLSYCTSGDNGCLHGTLGISADMGVLFRRMLDDLKAQEVEMILTHRVETFDGFSFIYEAKETGMEDLYLSYRIALTDILPCLEKGVAA